MQSVSERYNCEIFRNGHPFLVNISPDCTYASIIVDENLGLLVEVETGCEVLKFWGTLAAFSADSRYVVVKNGIYLQLYEIEIVLSEYMDIECEENITALTFSADGRYLVAGCEDSSLILWDISGDCLEPRRFKRSF